MANGRITLIDVAKAAGVSKSTVSLVLQRSPLVGAATRAKILGVMQELGYVYHRGAASLRRTNANSGIVGIVVNDLTNSFFAELAVGIDSVIQAAGYVQFLAHTGERVDRQTEVIASMREHGVSGLIIAPARGTSLADLKPLMQSPMPVVLVMRSVPGAKFTTLVTDNYRGTYAAVEHLAALGHQQIAFLGGFEDTVIFHERCDGYRQAVKAFGLRQDEALVVPSAPSRAGGFQAITALLSKPLQPTAAVCFNDSTAFGVCDGLRAAKLEPGRDFSVIGFDDVIEAKTAVPSLTTLAVDPQRVGQRVAQLLLRQINSGVVEAETLISPVTLVVRDSCHLIREEKERKWA